MPESRRLQFTRDGRYLAVLDEDGVAIASVGGEPTRRIAAAGARAIAAFADEVWVAGADGDLVRFGVDGRPRPGRVELPPAAQPALHATTTGVAGALWTSAPAVGIVDDLGTLVDQPAPDAVLVLSARRWVRNVGGRTTLPSGAAVATASGKLVGGSALFDGSALLAVLDTPAGRIAAVVHPVTARVLQRVELPVGDWRVASRRGIVAVQVAPDRLALFDLRLGRALGTIDTGAEIGEHALDPDARVLAFRSGAAVELASVADGLARSARRAPSTTTDDDDDRAMSAAEPAALAAHVTGVDEPASPAAEPALVRPLAVGLAPRPHLAAPARAEVVAELDRELRTVALWTLAAIARSWDTRRLGYANEGNHPYEHEVAALVGMNRGFAQDYVAAAADELAAHERALAAEPAHRSEGAPLVRLAAEHALSPTAVAILLVVAAPGLEAEAARLYGILGNDPRRAIVDEALVHQVLGERASRHAIAAELAANAPLVQLGIVAIEPGRPRPFAALAVNPVVLAQLRGEALDLGAATTVRAADRRLEALELAAGVLPAALAALARRPTSGGPLRLACRGRPGSGRRTLLAALASEANRQLAVIDAAALPTAAEPFARALRAALQRAHLAGHLPAVVGLEDVFFDGRGATEVAREVLRAHPGPLAVVASPAAPVPLAADHVAIELPVLGETERLAVWQRTLAGAHRWLRDPAGIAARFRIGPGSIHRALAACTGPATEPCDDAIDAHVRQARDARLGEHARRVDRLSRWADLVLPPDIMDSLRELVGRVRHRRTVFETWGMGRTMATSRGITALFQGQPGTGKTLVAGVIARELGLELYQVDLSKVTSKWLGETERNLGAIFDAAEDGQVILLFDEADSLFARRTEVRSSNDRYANLEVNYLLQRLDAFDGIAILTTNSGGSIDPAFKRRLSFRISFPFPDEETRAELWRAHLPPELPRAGELVFDQLARKYQLSGGYIRNACLRAAFLAAQEDAALAQHHLERAVALEFTEVGKLSTSGTIT